MTRRGKQALIGVRVEERVKRVVEEIAAREGRSAGELFREALAEWLQRRYPSLPLEEDHSLEAFLTLVQGMKAEGQSWAEISAEVERRFGVKVDKDQLKAFIR